VTAAGKIVVLASRPVKRVEVEIRNPSTGAVAASEAAAFECVENCKSNVTTGTRTLRFRPADHLSATGRQEHDPRHRHSLDRFSPHRRLAASATPITDFGGLRLRAVRRALG
jgi:hypothetical protein